MNSERTCATCKNWLPGKTTTEVRALRMAICRLLPRWQYLPPHASCKSFVTAADKAIAARAGWLAKDSK